MINSLSLYGNLRYGQEYDLYTDGELIKKFNVGNEQAEKCMLKRYFYLIRRIVNSFYITDGRKDDILQESMIGLFRAMKTYDENYGVSFKTYAEICILVLLDVSLKVYRRLNLNIMMNLVSILVLLDVSLKENH